MHSLFVSFILCSWLWFFKGQILEKAKISSLKDKHSYKRQRVFLFYTIIIY